MADNDFATGYALGADSTGGNGGGMGNFFSGDGIWAILLFAMIFGWGNGGIGNGGGGYQQAVSSGFALNGLQNDLRGVQNGLSDGFYAMNTSLLTGFNGVTGSITQLGYQLQDCCCKTQGAIQDVRYDMAREACDTRNLIQTTTRDLIENQNANTRAILDFLTQDKIASLQAENQSLKFAASQANQNAVLQAAMDANTAELIRRINPTPVPAYQVPAPYPYGHRDGGCGCGC